MNESEGSEVVTTRFFSLRITVLAQLLVTLCLSLLVGYSNQWLWLNMLSIWVGGLVATTVFVFGVWRGLLRNRPVQYDDAGSTAKPEQLLLQMVSAEFSKLLLGLLLLGLLFKFAQELHSGLIISGFAVGIIVNSITFAAADRSVAGKQQ